MDVEDKAARVLYEMRLSEHGVYTAAQKLIAAFPQLALEGREEWGTRYDESRLIPAPDRVTADVATASIRNSITQHRTVWESPWSEVQS